MLFLSYFTLKSIYHEWKKSFKYNVFFLKLLFCDLTVFNTFDLKTPQKTENITTE